MKPKIMIVTDIMLTAPLLALMAYRVVGMGCVALYRSQLKIKLWREIL